MTTLAPEIAVDEDRLAAFCRKWDVARLELFGSFLTGDVRPDSDADLLVTFSADVDLTAYMLLDMGDKLEALFGRRVDLIPRDAVEHGQRPEARRHIFETARGIYKREREGRGPSYLFMRRIR